MSSVLRPSHLLHAYPRTSYSPRKSGDALTDDATLPSKVPYRLISPAAALAHVKRSGQEALLESRCPADGDLTAQTR
jgi:hypothetical protein